MEFSTATNAEGQPLPSSAVPLLYDNTDTRKARNAAKTNVQGETHYDNCRHYSPLTTIPLEPVALFAGPVRGARGQPVAVEPVDEPVGVTWIGPFWE